VLFLNERGRVAGSDGFQEQVRKLGELVSELESTPDGPQQARAREVVQLLMEIHGQGLERILEIAFESGQSGADLIDRLGKDEIAGGLLLLYSLHPDSLETRVESAVGRHHARLRKLGCAVELLSVEEGMVRIRLKQSGHACGSSAKELRAIVESAIYETAPDLTGLEIEGLEEPAASGFVALERLLGHAAKPSHDQQAAPVAGGD
jgi:Fe-S cluster biogenesis protein NfuA